MRALIDIKQIDISKLNDVKIYDELPLEVEGQVAYCQGKLYYGDGSEWNELGDGGGGLPEGTENQTLRHNGTEWVANDAIRIVVSDGNSGDIALFTSGDTETKEVFIEADEVTINTPTIVMNQQDTTFFAGGMNIDFETNASTTFLQNELYIKHPNQQGNIGFVMTCTNTDGKAEWQQWDSSQQVQADWKSLQGKSVILNKPNYHHEAYGNRSNLLIGIQDEPTITPQTPLIVLGADASGSGWGDAISIFNSGYMGGQQTFAVRNNGTIFSERLKNTTSSLLEALPDGTIQRSTVTIPAAQVNSDWNATEGVAQILNKPVIPQDETVNIETLTADKTLTASDATVQIYTSDANRVVNLPTTGLTLGQKFVFWNRNTWDNLNYYDIKKSGVTIDKVYSQSESTMIWDGSSWYKINSSNVAFGFNSNGANGGVSFGANANANSSGIAIGLNADGNNNGVSIGKDSQGYTSGVSIGYQSVGYTYSVAIGRDANSSSESTAIGSGAVGTGYSVAIGNQSKGANYCVAIGFRAGKDQITANRLYIHSSTSSVGANSLIYGEFDNRIVRINNTLYVNDLAGTGDRPVLADPTGKLKIGSTTLPSRTEYLSDNLTGTEHIFTGATLGITGDLRSRIKNIKCFAVDSSGDYNGALIANEFIYETDVTVNTATNLSGSFKIILFIEYV